MADFQNSIKKIQRAINYLNNDAKTIMGVEAVNHFKESFKNQGFTDKTLEKWEDVERRNPQSPWYGFSYGSTVAKPGRKKRNPNSMTNYSPAATKRPILSGQSQELLNSITWTATSNGVRVFSNLKYANIQNNGGNIQIFGNADGRIPRRQFMGKSEVMRSKIRKQIITDLKKILK